MSLLVLLYRNYYYVDIKIFTEFNIYCSALYFNVDARIVYTKTQNVLNPAIELKQ